MCTCECTLKNTFPGTKSRASATLGSFSTKTDTPASLPYLYLNSLLSYKIMILNKVNTCFILPVQRSFKTIGLKIWLVTNLLNAVQNTFIYPLNLCFGKSYSVLCFKLTLNYFKWSLYSIISLCFCFYSVIFHCAQLNFSYLALLWICKSLTWFKSKNYTNRLLQLLPPTLLFVPLFFHKYLFPII